METSGDIIIQKDEIEWIERQKHNLILRTYRLNTQRLIKEYELKIQQQNRKIEFLLKEVKRQKFIIDTFSNENNGNIHNESLPEISNGIIKNDIESDSELEEIFHPDTKFHGLSHENAKSKYIQENICKKINKNDLDRTEIERKNTSLLSIEIKPQYQCNIQPLVNVYICDECNKTVSSRRVLAKHKRMVHCSQKEFVCDHCSKAFCVRDGLKRHLRIHTGEKPFVCRGCNKGFNQSGNMRIHEKTCKNYLSLNGHSIA